MADCNKCLYMPACKDKTNAMLRYIAYDEEIDIECDKFKDEADFNAEIERLQAENDDLFYKLQGVMWFVDKWLDGEELEQDELNRAITMREKTLRITEEQQAEIERLEKARHKQAQFLEEERGQKYELINKITKAKTDAIKEYDYRLWLECVKIMNLNQLDVMRELREKVIEEMVGEQDD